MTTFRRIEEMHIRETFSGEYTTYDAFLYQGPFTDYPGWAQYAFQGNEMKAPNAHTLLIVKGERKYPDLEMLKPKWPVENGMWVMKVYRHVNQNEYTVELKEYTTEQLRMEFYPTQELTHDEATEYFDVNDLTEGNVVVPIPVKFRAFKWKGVAHATPWWLQQALTSGLVTLKGASLYNMHSVARPGDWVLWGGSGEMRMMTQAQYDEAGGK